MIADALAQAEPVGPAQGGGEVDARFDVRHWTWWPMAREIFSAVWRTCAAHARLSLSQGTVRNYLSEAIGKLGVGNRIEAYRLARQKGWL